uniref:Probable oligoribonuclease n=2 Tax=Caenorhabditis japonica TaxID=281687 RepID=A0A8R1DJB6_CAEJA
MLTAALKSINIPISRRAMSTLYHVCDTIEQRIIWIDCEMTGLNVEAQTLCEIAVIVTDSELNTVATGPDIVIHQPKEVLDNMEEWPRKTFLENGLMDKIVASKYSMTQAENEVIDFLKLHTLPGKSPIAGNSIHMDRMFIRKYMPKLDEFAHYRCIDVSTIKGLVQRWYPDHKPPRKMMTHRAFDDIMESITELKHYRENIFVKKVDSQ